MKKSTGVVAVVVVAGVAYLGATWYVGQRAQATIEHAVLVANERIGKVLGVDAAGSGLKLTVDKYQRHFFSSDVTYTLRVKDQDGKPVELILQDHLQHGPFPLDALRAGDFTPMLAFSQSQLAVTPAIQKWFDSQKGLSPLQVETRVGFGGSGKSAWTFAPTEIAIDGEKLSFSGGVINVSFSNDFNDNVSSGKFDALSVFNEQTRESVTVKNIQLDSTTTSSGKDVKLKSKATIDSLVAGDTGDGPVTIENLSINLDSHQQENMLDGVLQYEFGRLLVGDVDMGSVSVGGKVQHLDIAALTALAAEYDAIQARQGADNDQELVLSPEEEASLREKLMVLLASNPAVELGPLTWKNAKGESRAALQVNLAKPANVQEQRVDVLAAEILKRVKLDLSVSKAMLIQAMGQGSSDPQEKLQMEMMGAMIYDQYVARLSEAGLLKLEGDNAAAAVLYENNKVDLNGTAMSVEELMQRAMSVMM
ncbi:YdgA family protein [Alcaligenaceae bacterium]|nr:YdgA family protein [Alcaligenaceae bacterium]